MASSIVRRTAGRSLGLAAIALCLVATGAQAAMPSQPTNGRYPVYGAEVYTTTPTLAAIFRDDDHEGWIEFEIYGTAVLEDGGGGGSVDVLVANGRGSSTSNGGFSRWVVPPGRLRVDADYRWRARAYDGSSYSGWTADERVLWVRPWGTRADDVSFQPSSAADGQTVAFTSHASNLVGGDTNNVADVYVRHIHEGVGLTTRVTWGENDSEPNGSSWEPSISDDGRFVAFSSAASNLVSGDTNGATDVFVADLDTGDIVRASVTDDGAQLSAALCFDPHLGEEYVCATPGYAPSISGDGRYVAFVSESAGVIAGGSTASTDAYLFDRVAGRTVERVSVSMTAGPGGGAAHPSISDDGSKVAFDSWQPIVAGDTNQAWDVFVRDRAAGVTRRASVTDAGAQVNANSTKGAISGNGLYVAFESSASNLLERDVGGFADADSNARSDVFRQSLDSGRLIRVSGPSRLWEPNGHASSPAISDDGSRVVFESASTNRSFGACTDAYYVCDTNNAQDIYEWNSAHAGVTRVSYDDRYGELEQPSIQPSISGDGTAALFATYSAVAGGLAPGTPVGSFGVYRHIFEAVGCVLIPIAVGVGIGEIVGELPSRDEPGRFAMRVQLQQGTGAGNTLAENPLQRPARPIAVREVQALLGGLYAQAQGLPGPTFPKKRGLRKLYSAIVLASNRLNTYPPGGISGRDLNFVQETFSVPGRDEYRVDVDNLSGWNLRTLYPGP